MARDLHTVMTREQAIEQFKEYQLPSIIKDELDRGIDGVYRIDEVMRSEAWSHFTDSLCKGHEISDWQYMNWSTPDCCER